MATHRNLSLAICSIFLVYFLFLSSNVLALPFTPEPSENFNKIYDDFSLAVRDPEGIVEQAKEILAQHPNSAPAHALLGTALFGTERLQEASTHFKKATELDPTNSEFWTKLGIVQMELNQLKEAQHALQKAIKLEPLLPLSYFNLGNTYFEIKDYSQAERAVVSRRRRLWRCCRTQSRYGRILCR